MFRAVIRHLFGRRYRRLACASTQRRSSVATIYIDNYMPWPTSVDLVNLQGQLNVRLADETAHFADLQSLLLSTNYDDVLNDYLIAYEERVQASSSLVE